MFTIDDKTWIQELEICNKELKHGSRKYLRCPVTHAACNELHLIGGLLASRKAHRFSLPARPPTRQRATERQVRMRDRLLGVDGRGPARGRRRERLILTVRSDVEKLGYVPTPWEELTPLMLEWERLRARDQARASRYYSFVDTESGIVTGQRLDTHQCLELSKDASYSETGLARAQPERPLASVDQFCSLSLKQLREWWHLEDRILQGYAMGWVRNISGATVRVVGDLRDGSPSGLMVSFEQSDGQTHRQVIRIVRSAQGKTYLECPVILERCDELYLRDGYFAARKAQRLVYPSQRGKGFLS